MKRETRKRLGLIYIVIGIVAIVINLILELGLYTNSFELIWIIGSFFGGLGFFFHDILRSKIKKSN